MTRPCYLARHAAALAIVALAAACGRDASARTDSPAPRVEEVSDSSLVRAPHPERYPLVAVASQPVADRLSGTCIVSPDVNRTVPVNALGGGRVVALEASLGDRVRRGQPLVVIRSPDLSQALADNEKAGADEALAAKQLDRSRVLYEHGSIARKDLEAAEDAEAKAQVDVRATADRVRMLGGDPGRATPDIELRSPIDGTIIEQNVTPGAGVKSPDNAPNLFTVADLSHVWVLCDVYENDLSRARVGELARITLNAYPDRPLTGRIGNISQVLDPNTRTAKVRVELDNAAGLMRPGMFATAQLVSSVGPIRMLLPTTALVQMHDAQWVFIRVGDGAFRRVRVHAGAEVQPGLQEIVEGVAPGQQVVRNALAFVQDAQQ